MKRLLGPFSLAVVACLILAGWALWSGGITDGTIARQVRTSSVYAAPGTGLQESAAERVIGNRRLVVILLKPGGDLRGACHGVRRAAQGTLVLVLSRSADGFDTYGCATFADDDDFGKSFVSEQIVAQGLDGFADRPLDAVKVIAVNYDLLVKAGIVPDGARKISPSLPRYLIAIAAIVAVLLGSAFVYFAGRRAGGRAAGRAAARGALSDERSHLSAAAGALAQQIVALDGLPRPPTKQVAADYADLLHSDADPAALLKQIEALGERLRQPSGRRRPPRSRR